MKVEKDIAKFFIKRRETLAVAESVTAGLLQNKFTQTENTTEYFEGGITAYNIMQKSELLGVDFQHAITCNCVSERVAAEMALGVVRLFKSDFGIAVTGYAEPVPEINVQQIFAFFAIAYKGEIIKAQRITSDKSSMKAAQEDYCTQILTATFDYFKDSVPAHAKNNTSGNLSPHA